MGMKQAKNWVIGYDPGGNNAHGVAALAVISREARWTPERLLVEQKTTVGAAVEWFEHVCRGGRIVAAGVDTLTEWNDGRCGWRPADLWLRMTYREVAKSVIPPNSIYGAMTLNGGAFLHSLAKRFEQDGAVITEAHPKVALFALTQTKTNWKDQAARDKMTRWLLDELAVAPCASGFGASDHDFDAAMAVLAALRGLNGDWKLDLHSMTGISCGKRIQPFGATRFWWPHDDMAP